MPNSEEFWKSPNPRVCVVHDFFLYRGGAERFDVMAAIAAGADLAAAYFDPGSFDLDAMGFKGKKIAYSYRSFPEGGFVAKILPKKLLRMLRYAHFKRAASRNTGFLREYDTVVFSGDTLGAEKNCRPGARKICYFHSIPRYLFDQRDLYMSKVPWIVRPFFAVARGLELRKFYRHLSRMDAVYVNGKNLRAYAKTHLGIDADILYPPVDTKEFAPCDPSEKDDYFISFSKLATFKRVDMVVKAFARMPEKRLLVIYGANDPQKNEVLAHATTPNIECRILSDNAELPGLVARATATIFVSRNEDFGMVAIESMAAGTPVIGADSGGIRETVVPGVTGVFVPEEFTIEELESAVRSMTPERALSMREACIERVRDEFGKERFGAEVRKAFLA